jgi:hypothetical protein
VIPALVVAGFAFLTLIGLVFTFLGFQKTREEQLLDQMRERERQVGIAQLKREDQVRAQIKEMSDQTYEVLDSLLERIQRPEMRPVQPSEHPVSDEPIYEDDFHLAGQIIESNNGSNEDM